MMIANARTCSAAHAMLRRTSPMQRAGMHLGRATATDTQVFVERSATPSRAVKLRLGADSFASITRHGIGSPYLWAKDVPRIDATKHALSNYQSNFIQASFNPYLDTPAKPDEKQSFVESLVIQEVIEDEGIPREALVLSVLLEDSFLRPTDVDVTSRLSSEFIQKGLKLALNEWDVEAVDHMVLRVPEELLVSDSYRTKAHETLKRAADALETLCSAHKIQSFGFALSSLASSASPLERLIETSFLPLSEQHASFSSLQIPVVLGSSVAPFPTALQELQRARGVVVMADKVFHASLSNGKPIMLHTYTPHQGEDIALLLKSAFNLAIGIERKYMETILPENSQRLLPAAEDVAWAHILANQHSQFDNLEEWIYIRETQILPLFEITIKQLNGYEELKEFGFAYSMAMRELLKCFTASVEILDADRAEHVITAFKEHGLLVNDDESLEHVAAKAALSAGADVVLFQEQLGKTASFSAEPLYSPTQLDDLARLARPLLVAE